jgi:hypothetical protein
MDKHAIIDLAIERVLQAETTSFIELAKIAGLDPKEDFRFANLAGTDFSNLDLGGFDFFGARLDGASFKGAKVEYALFQLSASLRRQLSEAADGHILLSNQKARSRVHDEANCQDPDVATRTEIAMTPSASKDEFDAGVDRSIIKYLREIRKQGGTPREIFGRGKSWLDENSKNNEHASLTASVHCILVRFCSDAEADNSAIAWLEDNAFLDEAAVLIRELLGKALNEQVVKAASTWLDANFDKPNALMLISALLKHRELAPKFRNAAQRWVQTNQNSPGAANLYIRLLKTVGDSRLQRDVRRWLSRSNLPSNAADALWVLLKVSKFSVETQLSAVKWLATHQTHDYSARLLVSLLRSGSPHAEVLTSAIRWLADTRNESWYARKEIYEALMLALPNDPKVRSYAHDLFHRGRIEVSYR